MKCPQFFIGDGICDSECNNKECDYDNGDCGEEDSDDYIVTVMTAVGFGLIAVTFCGQEICRIVIIAWKFFRKHRFFNRNTIQDIDDLGSAESAPVIYKQIITLELINKYIPETDFLADILEFHEKTCSVCLEE